MEHRVIDLRAHHGMCLAVFQGKGYSGEFVTNMAEMKAVLEENPSVRLRAETDEICAACPHNLGGCCESGEKVIRYDREVLRRCGLREGTVLPYRDFEALVRRRILETGQREEICGGCQWSGLCHWERGEA